MNIYKSLNIKNLIVVINICDFISSFPESINIVSVKCKLVKDI